MNHYFWPQERSKTNHGEKADKHIEVPGLKDAKEKRYGEKGFEGYESSIEDTDEITER